MSKYKHIKRDEYGRVEMIEHSDNPEPSWVREKRIAIIIIVIVFIVLYIGGC